MCYDFNIDHLHFTEDYKLLYIYFISSLLLTWLHQILQNVASLSNPALTSHRCKHLSLTFGVDYIYQPHTTKRNALKSNLPLLHANKSIYWTFVALNEQIN